MTYFEVGSVGYGVVFGVEENTREFEAIINFHNDCWISKGFNYSIIRLPNLVWCMYVVCGVDTNIGLLWIIAPSVKKSLNWIKSTDIQGFKKLTVYVLHDHFKRSCVYRDSILATQSHSQMSH